MTSSPMTDSDQPARQPTRLLRIIRLDGSDASVFERSANAGEWAVTGGFMFLDDDDTSLSGKRLQAFRNGLLGISSFGWATLAEVATLTEDEFDTATKDLAAQFVRFMGAPDLATALPAARDELLYAASVCEHEPGTLIALSREIGDDGITENLHVVRPNAGDHDSLKIWEWAPDASKD